MKIGVKINETFNLGANKTYFHHLGEWYHHLKDFPGILADMEGYVKFDTQDEYENNPNLQHSSQLNIKGGISSLHNYIRFNEEQLYIVQRIRANGAINPIFIDINNQA